MKKKKDEKFQHLSLLAEPPERVDWLLNLKTLIQGMTELQGEVRTERSNLASEYAKAKIAQSAANTAGGRALKKAGVTREALDAFKKEFEFKNGTTRGWIKVACAEFATTPNTIRARLKEE